MSPSLASLPSASRRGARLLLALACVLGLATTAAAQSFVAFDPKDETVLVGPGAAAPDALRLGDWRASTDGVVLERTAPGRENYWIPLASPAELGDGFVRARFESPRVPDLSVLLRTRAAPEDVAGLSGYAISVEGGALAVYRFDTGVVRPLARPVKVPKLRRLRALEVVVWAVGPHLSAQVYDGATLELVAAVAASDPTYATGRVGVRVHARSGGGETLRLLTVRRAGEPVTERAAPAGVLRFVAVPTASRRAAARLVGPLVEVDTVPESGEVVLQTDVVGVGRLARAGIAARVLDVDSPFRYLDADYRATRARPPERTPTGYRVDASYKDPEMVEALLRAFHARFPRTTALHTLGTTAGGRPILALRITDHPDRAEDDEASVLLMGAHHGDELVATEVVLDAIQALLEGGGDPRVRRWVRGLDIWCVPLVNPDGTHAYFTWSTWAGRKNARDTNGNGQFDATDGVDLNRNYPFRWGALGEVASRSLPRALWFRGPSPGSEAETQAIMRLADAERFVAALSYHTWGTVILAPYTIDGVQSPEPNEAWTVAEELAEAAARQPNGRRFRVRRNIYPVDGTDQDWLRATHGTVALIVEAAYHNPTDPDVRRATVSATRGTWQALLDRILDGPGVSGHVRDRDGHPVIADVSLDELRPREGERWTSRARDGRFDRLVPAPGRYTVRAVRDGQVVSKTVRVGAGGRARVELVLP